MVELESFPWAQRDIPWDPLTLPAPSSLRPAGSSDFVPCWAGCLRDELSRHLLLLPLSQWGGDHQHQRCSVGLTSTLRFKPAPASAHPGLEPQLREDSSETGSPGSWTWPFWSRTSSLQTFGRAGVGEEELSGILAMGHIRSIV